MVIGTTSDWTITANRIISRALRIVGAIVHGVTPTKDKLDEAMIVLNALVKELDSEHPWPWKIETETFSSVSGKSDYDHADGLPDDIFKPLSLVYIDSTTSHFPIDLVGYSEYDRIQNKTSSGIPQIGFLTNNLDVADRVLYLWPVPSSARTVQIRSQKRLLDFDLDSDNPDFPQDWFNFLSILLASELGEEYGTDSAKIERLQVRAQAKGNNLMGKSNPGIDNHTIEHKYY